MELSEEEKKAIEWLENAKFFSARLYAPIILNLLDQYPKEIEELKEKNKTLETLLQGNLYEMYLYYKELYSRYQANSISKDKIREKIKELEKLYNCNLDTALTSHEMFVFVRSYIDKVKNILNQLLEEDKC